MKSSRFLEPISLSMATSVVVFLSCFAAATVTLNETTFDNPGNANEPITDGGSPGHWGASSTYGGDTINGWTFFLEASGINKMTFAPDSNLDIDAPDGVGETELEKGLTAKPHGPGGSIIDVINLEWGTSGAIAGIAQTFDSQPMSGGTV